MDDEYEYEDDTQYVSSSTSDYPNQEEDQTDQLDLDEFELYAIERNVDMAAEVSRTTGKTSTMKQQITPKEQTVKNLENALATLGKDPSNRNVLSSKYINMIPFQHMNMTVFAVALSIIDELKLDGSIKIDPKKFKKVFEKYYNKLPKKKITAETTADIIKNKYMHEIIRYIYKILNYDYNHK